MMPGGISLSEKIKAVIFDMDGVLIDAKDWHYEALNRALSLFGMEISRYDHLITYDGLPTKKKLEMLTLERSLPRDLHEFLNDMKQKYTMEIIHARCKPTFGHQFALSHLRQDGYRLALCSNSVRKTIEIMMDKACLIEYLDFFLSNQDVVRAKPDPEIYCKAIEMLGLRPQQCLVLEDNENGIRSAMGSGAHVMRINQVDDVNYERIIERIGEIEGEMS